MQWAERERERKEKEKEKFFHIFSFYMYTPGSSTLRKRASYCAASPDDR